MILGHLVVLGDWAKVLLELVIAFAFSIRIDKIEIQLAWLDELDRSNPTALHIDAIRRVSLSVLAALNDTRSICLRI